MAKKIISIILVLILLILPIISLATTTEELNKQIEDIRGNISEAEGRQHEIEGEISQTQSEINKLNDEIAEKEYEIEQITAELNALNEEVNDLTEKLEEAQANYDNQYDMLGKRLAAQHKRGTTSYLEVLLNSKSLTDLIARYHIIEKIAELDTQLLNDIKEQQQIIEAAKKEVEKKQSEVAEKQAQLKTEGLALSNRKLTKDKYISQLTAEEQKIQSDLEAYNNELKKAEQEIAEIARQAALNNSGGSYSGGKLLCPVNGTYRISSYFGYRGTAATGGVGTANHNGYDMAAAHYTPIVAAESGTVIKVIRACSHDYPKTSATKCNCGGGYGNYLMIYHGEGITTLYGHCASISVNVGDVVYRGQQIGQVGSCGWSTGYHLHFSVLLNNTYVDPGLYL